MSALLTKDFYTINKQLRLYLVILVVFAAFTPDFGTVFLPVWSSMLPYTSIAYDEQSKWDQLAATMPYSVRDLVLSKYVFGWICIAVITALSLVIQTVMGLLGFAGGPDFAMAVTGLGSAIGVMALSLPMIFRFGVERGRLFIFLVIFLVCGTAGGLSYLLEKVPLSVPMLAGGIPLLGLVITAVSVPLSMRAYAKRQI